MDFNEYEFKVPEFSMEITNENYNFPISMTLNTRNQIFVNMNLKFYEFFKNINLVIFHEYKIFASYEF